MALRVLMLGWEFPPFITGGLGTACYGLTRALDRQNVEVTFVLPKTVPADSASHVRLVSPGSILERTGVLPTPAATVAPAAASATNATTAPQSTASTTTTAPSNPAPPQVPQTEQTELMTRNERETWTSIVNEFTTTKFLEIPGEYGSVYDSSASSTSTTTVMAEPSRVAQSVRMMREAGWSIERIRTLARTGAFPELTRDPVERAIETALPETAGRNKDPASARGADSADYSGDLLGMAERYMRFAVDATRGMDFDVIHAHDWLTYPAGLAIAKITGKPLIVHVHSTEFDRSGEHPNQQVYNIERRGMHGATRAIAVSMLTKNVCVNR